MSRRKLLLETFEDRILCSITAPVAAEAPPKHAAPTTHLAADPKATIAAVPPVGLQHAATVPPAPAAAAPATAAPTADAATTSRELIVINGNLLEAEQLIAELTKNQPGRSFQVVTLDTYRDGVDQITELLAASGGKFDAIHLLGHGDAGYITLGATRLDVNDLGGYADEIARWGLSLNSGADILFYGCSFASGAAGQQIVQRVAQLTGADVAASIDPTGAATMGGNWNLEYSVGAVQSTLGAQAGESVAWSHLLGGTPIDGGVGAFAGVFGNKIYSISFDTGKATLVGTSSFVGAGGTLNSLGIDSVNGIVYYADSANGSKGLYGFDLRTGQQFTLAADVTSFGVTLPAAGLGAAGGDFAGGNYYFSTEGGGPNNRDQIYKVTFTSGSNGRTVQSISIVNYIDGANEFGDFIVVPGGTTKLWSFNSSTSVDEYNLTGTGTNLTAVQQDANTNVTQGALDRSGNLYTVGTAIRSYNPAGAGTFGAALNITTNGTTALGALSDGSAWVPAEASIGDRVWYDADLDAVQDVGENGVVGLTVKLYDDLNGNGAIDAGERLLATTTTGANGAYTFGQLLPGDYLIQVSDPTSIMQGAGSTTGGNLQAASISQVGQAVVTKDFGYEQPATISVSSPAVTEGTDAYAVFTVSLSNKLQNAVSVNLALANGSATGGGVDYGAGGATNLQVSTDGGTTWNNATTATIAAGSTSVLVRTPIVNDTLDEANETFTLTATKSAGLTANNSAVGTATITDDDPAPSLVINDVTYNEAAGTATFTVTLSTASGQAVSVNYATSNGTATAGSDYTSTSGTLNFAAGVVSQTITVPILNDTLFESSETFNVNLSGAVNATIADNLGVGTIKDDGTGTGGTDNDTPTLTVSSPAVTEGTDAFAIFTVALSNASTTAVSVNLALANGSATGGGTDYGAAGATNLQVSTDGGTTWTSATAATIAAGTTSVLVRTPIINDTLNEPAETFTLTATKAAGTTTNASATGTATITDNDPLPSLVINDVTVNEAAGTATFTVTLNTASGRAVSVDYATSNGTATAGADYTAASGTLSFAAGVISQTITVPILNDTTFESSETFNVNLSGAVNATIADNLGVGTIKDDGTGTGGADNDTPTLAVSSPAVTEGASTYAIFTVSLSNLSTTAVSVNLALANGTAVGGGTDFGPGIEVSTDGGTSWSVAGAATIAAGSTSVLVRTPIVNDALNEAPETFTLAATRTAGTTTNASATGTATITDNDPQPSLSIDNLTVNESDGTATFTVSLSAASGLPVSVNYATSDDTALAGSDYNAKSGTLNFAAGVTSQTVTVTIKNDSVYENTEDYFVTLSGATNATIANATGTGTILDDDTSKLTVSDVVVTEGTDSYAVFTITIEKPQDPVVTMNLALANGTATGGGVDYGSGSAGNLQVSNDGGVTWTNATTATLPKKASTVLVRTPITNDALSEGSETFVLLVTPTAGITSTATLTGTANILDDDPLPSMLINDVTVNEAAGTATFTVTLNTASAQAVSVNYATSNGTATAGADYTSTSGTLNFAAGVTSQTITVPILNDTTYEGSETFNVTLSAAVNATIADNLGVGTIKDDGTGTGGADNDTPTLSVSSPAVTEGTSPFAVFTVSLSNLSTTAVSLSLALANGTATGGGVDYGAGGATNLQVSTDGGTTWTNATNTTIAAGSTSVLVRTPITDDALNEAAETFTLTATRTAGTTTNLSATGTATIIDDDPAPSLTINDVTVNEAAGTATFTVTLNTASGQAVSVNYATSNGTATSGADYTTTSGTLNFAAGVVSQTITVSVLNDATYEGSETFNVNLSGAVNATIADNLGVGSILDDGTGTGGTDNDTPTLSVSNVSVTEGADPFAVFTVALSNLSTTAVSVNLALAAGTAAGGGVDYGAGGATNLQVSTDGGTTWTNATVATIAAGSASVLVRTPIINDALAEAAETFTLTATRTAGTTTNGSALGTATIIDDDPTASLVINDVTVNEGAGTATFTVTLSAPSGQAVSVNYATNNGTATAGADYSAAAGTVTFTPGVTTQTITVPIFNDAVYENSETFNVLLSSPVNAVIADNTGVGTIKDDGAGFGGTDNDTPTLTVSNVTATEGTDPYAVFAVNLSNASTTAVLVNLALANGTALGGGTDYGASLEVSTDGGSTWASASGATIAAGSTSVLVRTPITDDALNEASETFTLTATRIGGTTSNGSATGTATIVDNDAQPSLTINDVTVNEAAGTATFTVTLNAPSGQGVSVAYATSNGTATAGADYTAATGTLNFAAGVVSQTITVPILNDTTYEGSENFNVTLSGAVNATIADNLGVGTILDDGTGGGGADNDTPSLSVSNVTVTEGTNPYAVFTVALSNLSTTAVSVNLALAAGTAAGGGVDYGAGGATNLQVSTDGGTTWTNATAATIAAGSASVLVRTPIINDALDEAAETFTLTATKTAGTTTNASALGTATIIDDDPTPSLVINDVTVNEGAGTATFTLTLSAPSGQAVSVNYATSDGTATTSADYTGTSGTLNFAAGVTSQTITVPILNDTTYEGSETFNVTLSGAVNATIADNLGVGTIKDDGTGTGGTDNDLPVLAVSSPSVMEGTDGFAIFTLSLSNASTTATTVNLALANGTATGGGSDYGSGGAGNLQVSTDGGTTWVDATSATFAAGSTSVLARTPIANDAIAEPLETFTLTATTTAGSTRNASAAGTATIVDDDGAPSVTIDDVTVNEAAGTATFTVRLTAVSALAISVDYATASGTATTGADFTSASGTLNFAPGVTSQTITISILNDTTYEGSESFNVLLSNPVNAFIGDGTGVGTILDNGTGAGGSDNDTPSLNVSNVPVTEGTDAFAVFSVSLSNPATTAVSVNLALANGTATGGGTDFGAGLEVSTDGGSTWNAASAATIAAGSTSVLVRTPITNDALDEAAETFTLTATRTAGPTTNSSATGTATITDDDATPSLTINDITVNEGTGTATFTVTLSAPSGQAVSVAYATASGTATSGADFTSTSGTLNFAAGVTTQTITVPILNDTTYEGSEIFNVLLSGPVNATIADGTGVGTILDDGTGTGGTDDDLPTASLTNTTVIEGTDSYAVFTLSLSNPSATATTFNLALADGSATGGGTDYGTSGAGNLQVSTDGGATWNDSTTATLAAGTTSVLVRTPITDDALNEASETFTLTATRTAGTTTNAAVTGTATIGDDDTAPTMFIDDVTVNEATGTATLTVRLSAASGLVVSANYATSSGTATSGADFTAKSGTVVFLLGQTTRTITVSITNDTVFEGSEFFNVTLSGASSGTIGDDTGVVTILDDGTGSGGADNDTPTLSVSSPNVTEGINPYAVFTVSLSNASTTPVSVGLALNNGTAQGGGTDFGTSGAGNLQVSTDGGTTWVNASTVTIAPGTTSVLARTPINDDTLDENTENFTLVATVTGGTTTNAAATGTGTITDNDPTPSLTIDDVTVNEAAGTATLTVTLSAASGLPVSVNYATSSGTATSGADFTGASGALNFAAGVTSQTITVAITNEAIYENSESFNVTLSGPTNATIADGSGLGTIKDDGTGGGGTDDDTPTLSVSSPSVTEGTDPYAIFTVSLSNPAAAATTVSLALTDGSTTGGGVDFGGGLEVSTDGGTTWTSSSTATIAGGSTSVLVRTPIINDALNEFSEDFTLTATRTAGTTTNASASGLATIVDNDATPSLSINDVTVNEAAGTATFTVTLSAASGLAVNVNYATNNGTATAGSDFTGLSGTLNFAPGVTSQTVTVSIVNDTIFEQSEAFTVLLSGAANATIADDTGIGTILDDGTGGGGTDNDTPTLSVSNVTATEGSDTHAIFAVNLSNLSTTPVSVNLALSDGTALGGGVDYGAGLEVSTDGGATWNTASTATIAAGSTGVLVRTPITDDALNEAAETFTLTATRTAGTTTNGAASGLATIVDNDALPTLSIDDVIINEGAGTATFTVTLNAASGQAVTVGYATSNGSATAGADYTSAVGTLNFAAGVTSQTITVPILNDTLFEISEDFNVTLSGAVNATIADGSGLGTIKDDGTGLGGTDDDTPTLSVALDASNVILTEGTNPYAVFAITLSNPSKTAVSVSLGLSDLTATGGGVDYGPGIEISTDGGATWVVGSNVTIAPFTTGVLARTPITDDLLSEASETFALMATRTAGITTNVSATGIATILDNDAQPTLSINDVTVNEAAGTATFTVTLSAVAGQPVSVSYATNNGTATAGADYLAGRGILNFAAGVTTQTVTVPILNDSTYEGSENFNVLLSGAINATIADGTGVGTILDDGTGPGGADNDIPSLSVSSVAVTEGTDPQAIFAVNLSNPSTTAVTVNLKLSNGTAVGGGTDFGPGLEVSTDGGTTWVASSSATIAAGTTSVLVRTPITDDALNENAEDFSLTATVSSGTTSNASASGLGTIADNDGPPALSIDDVTVNEAAGTATFTVSLSAASGQTIAVNYATSNGTATAALDYTGKTGSLTFAPGVTSQTVTISILNDTTYEGSESFFVLLSGATNAATADDTGVGTILDDGTGPGGADNDTPTLGVSNVTVTEGTDPYAIFTVSLSNLSTTPVDLGLALSAGSATGGGVDFGAGLEVSTDGGATWTATTSATIAAGSSSVLVRTPITDDVRDEAAEDFTLTATVTSGPTTNAVATGTATIVDDDATPTLSINDVTVNEAAGTATFTVTLSAASGLPVSVSYATSNGTATAGADYTATSGTLNFAAGVTSQTITVSIANDAIFEQSENFDVLLSGAVNAGIADGNGIGTILDDGTGPGGADDDTPTLSVSNVIVTEGTSTHAVFTVSLSNASTTPVNLNLALNAGTATGGGTDFGPNTNVSTDGGVTWVLASNVTIAAGTTSVLVRTPIIDDAINELSENFTLTATVAGGTTTNAAATGTATILDNDAIPSLSIDDVTVNEAAGTVTFTVNLSAASGLPVSVSYATSNGTATAGADYTATSGTLNFGAGVTSQTITVSIANDTLFEQSENFNMLLSGATNATIADDTGVGTILDDGTGPGGSDNDTPTLSVANVSVTEGTDPYAIFALTLSNPSATPVSVSLALNDGSATGGGTDYGAGLEVSIDGGATWTVASAATFAPGDTSVLVRTPVTDDAIDENAEDFTLTATVTSGTTTNAAATATATIVDDDPTPSLVINDVTVNEAAGTMTFTVNLSAASGLPVSVSYATSNGTATAGADYTAASGTLNFAAGVTSQTITISIANDTTYEGSENFNVLLSAPVNATIADAMGVGTILDDGNGPGGADNDTPTLSVSSPTVTEGTDPYAIFTVSLSNDSTTPVQVNLTLANGSATGSGTDFGPALEVSTDGGSTWVLAGSATLAPGSTSVLVRTPIIDDPSSETPETFTLTATVIGGTTTNVAATGTATILDNDAPPAFSIDDLVINEAAGTATFTVSLNTASGLPISVNYTTANGSARSGSDFTAGSGTLNFAPGVTSQTVVISILDDALFENTESFSVVLSGAVNATIADDTGAATILDDDVRQASLSLVATSDAGSLGNRTVVGEVATYELQLELAEGVNAATTLLDLLPAGMQFLPNSPVQVGYLNAGSAVTGFAAGTYTNATADALISASLNSNDDTYADGTNVFFKVGTLVNNDSDADREFVTIRFNAVVTNTLPNQAGVLLDNNFTALLDTDGNGTPGYVSLDRDGDNAATGTEMAVDALNDGTGTPAFANTVTTQVAEPILVLDKQITSAPAVIKAGDSITYTVTITHAAGSDGTAWEATLADAVPTGLQIISIDSVTLAGGAQEQTAAAIGGGGSSLGGVWDVPVGGSVTVVYRATVTSDVVLGSTLNNLADLTWSSLDGTSPDERGSGDGLLGSGGLNDYQLQKSVSATIENGASDFSIAKQVIGDSKAEIGERFTYQLTLTVADGILTNLSLNDLVPAGFRLVNGSANLTFGAGMVASGANLTYASNQLTLDVAQLQSAVDGLGNTITITYEVDALNSVSNNNGDVKTNLADATYAQLGATISASASVTIAEPVLDLVKTVDDDTPHLGQTVTYTLVISHNATSTADAFDLALNDALPPGVSLNAASIQLTSAPAGTSIVSNTSVDGGALQLALNQLALGESVTITFTATVSSDPAIIGGTFGGGDDTLSSTAALSFDSQPALVLEQRAGNTSAVKALTVVGADLAVTKSDGKVTATAGDQLTYTITVTNNGTDAATNVIVTDTLPTSDVAFNNAASTAGATVAGGKVVYNIPSLAAGATATFTVVVDVATPTSAGLESIANMVDVTHDDIEPTAADNTATDTDTLVSLPDYTITVTDNRTSAKPGEVVDYVITVTNAGNQNGTGVVVSDTFSTGIFSSVVADRGGVVDLANGTVVWNLGALAAGDSITLTLRGTVNATFTSIPVPVGTTPGAVPDNNAIAHTLNVADDGTGGTDPTPANNTASDVDDLQPVPELKITQTDNVTIAKPGQLLTYHIVATNAGRQDSNGMVVTDTLPKGVKLISVTSSDPALTGTPVVSGSTITWTFTGPVPAGEEITFTVVVRVKANVTPGSELVNRVRVSDDGFYGPDALTMSDNAATDTDATPKAEPVPVVKPVPAPAPLPAPFVFAFDTFHNFSTEGRLRLGELGHSTPIDLSPDAILPLVPIYSGEADPGATLVIALYNARGEQIGSQTVVADAGGNWLATFPSTNTRDVPNSVQITALAAPYSLGEANGHNLRTYYSPALNPGNFFLQALGGSSFGDESAPLLGGLGLENPLQLGIVKYGGELLGSQATAGGF